LSGGAATADPYSGARADLHCALNLQNNWDYASSTPWASWHSPATNDPCGGNHNSWRELYYDNATSLGDKYDLVNNRNIRGIGMWALGYDHGYTDLWNEIEAKLQCPPAPSGSMSSLTGSQTSTASTPLAATAYWPGWNIARGLSTQGNGEGGYVVDGWGGVHAFGFANSSVATSAYWGGWDIARDVATLPDGSGGYVLDGWGGIHPFATGSNTMPPAARLSAYWSGWDI